MTDRTSEFMVPVTSSTELQDSRERGRKIKIGRGRGRERKAATQH